MTNKIHTLPAARLGIKRRGMQTGPCCDTGHVAQGDSRYHTAGEGRTLSAFVCSRSEQPEAG